MKSAYEVADRHQFCFETTDQIRNFVGGDACDPTVENCEVSFLPPASQPASQAASQPASLLALPPTVVNCRRSSSSTVDRRRMDDESY